MAIPHPATRVHLLTLTALCPSLVSGERGTGAAQKGNSYTLELIGDDDGVFGCMSLLGCHDVCPKNLPLATQIAFLRRKMVVQGFK